jgi:hypothetical protein
VISRLRRAMAFALAFVVTLVTLGRVRVDGSGGPGATDRSLDPGGAAVIRRVDRHFS